VRGGAPRGGGVRGGGGAWGGGGSATRLPVVALSLWFVVGVWADVVVVAAGAWRLLDAIGLVLLVGVLGQAVTAVLTYLTPMLHGRHEHRRDHLRARLARRAAVRAVAYNLAGVVLAVSAAAGTRLGAVGAWSVRAAWVLLAATALHLLVVATAPVERPARPESGARTGPARPRVG
jgi:hypothetical protein